MCFGPKTISPAPIPTMEPPPKPSPLPTMTATQTEAKSTADQRRKRIAAATQYGLQSTIKTSALGTSGSGSDLVTGGVKKTKLGE
ncbi:MAG: hypothetical protein KAS32_05990 [Candidatus Peribacteraceae bacterium]|nr:hypothetical protein [Candidatus Peribacteraceae bacterium]